MALLDPVNAWLVALLGPSGPLLAVGLLGALLICLALPAMLSRPADPLDKLRAQARDVTLLKEKQARLRQPTGKDKLEKYSNFLEPQDEKEYSAVRLKLLQAGYRTKTAVRIYHFMQLALALGLLAAPPRTSSSRR